VDGTPSTNGEDSGGGGGAAGRIRINDEDGLGTWIAGTVTPSLSTAAAGVGTLLTAPLP
jgi:hypothetical protein